MRILVLGASGGCGSWVARLAIGRGHDVTAVARESSPYVPPDGVTLVHGDVLDAAFLDSLLAGNSFDAVVSGLGLRRTWIFPYARLLSPPDLVQRVVAHLTPAMSKYGVRRLLLISAGGVRESRAQTTFLVRRMIDAGNVGVAYRDLAVAEAHLESTDLDWCAVRPVTLVNGEPTGRAGDVSRYGIFSTVRRGDVGEWIVRHLDHRGDLPRRVLLGRTG